MGYRNRRRAGSSQFLKDSCKFRTEKTVGAEKSIYSLTFLK